MSAPVRPTTEASDLRLRAASEWIFRLQDEALTEAEIAEWIHWCEKDAENLAAFENMESMWRELGNLPPRIREKLAWVGSPERAAPAPDPSSPFWTTWGAGLALAASLVVVVSGVGYFRGADDRTATFAATSAALQSSLPHNFDATLPDGSTVVLAAKSSLSLQYNRSERRLRMRDGQALFKVHPDKVHPFVVEAGPVDIRAVGTAFDVRKNDDRIVVSVIEGIVEVSPSRPMDSIHGAGVRVAAGYQLVWDKDGTDVRLAASDATAASAWRAGRLEYMGEPLWAVVANVNRYSSHPIRIESDEVGALLFTGTVFSNAIDDWVKALPLAFPVTWERHSDGSYVIRGRV